MSFPQQPTTSDFGSFSNNNSFNNIVNPVSEIDTEGHQVLQWLSPLEPQQRHQDVRAARVDGVGK